MGVDIKKQFDALKCCVIIPTFNNKRTLQKVIDDVAKYTANIIVVNDGSTDGTQELLYQNSGIEVISYKKKQRQRLCY